MSSLKTHEAARLLHDLSDGAWNSVPGLEALLRLMQALESDREDVCHDIILNWLRAILNGRECHRLAEADLLATDLMISLSICADILDMGLCDLVVMILEEDPAFDALRYTYSRCTYSA